jgi:alpha-galactosidase
MTKPALPAFARLDGGAATLVLGFGKGVPEWLYWGPRLSAATTPEMLATLLSRGEAPASPAVPVPLALTPQAGDGWAGRPGLMAHRDGLGWASCARVEAVEQSPGQLRIISRDAANGLLLVHDLALDAQGVLIATTTLTNTGETPLAVEALAAPVLPVAEALTDIIAFEGRWALEFQTRRFARGPGSHVRENRRGRTSHDAFPGLMLAEAAATETAGAAMGVHLGWSGNHRLAVESFNDGRALVMAEGLLLPGEARLQPGESISSPALYAAVSTQGLNGLSKAFHCHLRARPEHARLRSKPRPVHYNSWEAVYFDHDPAVMLDLASRAAALGIERFVLDDGWFKGRRSDRAGLGDWQVDTGVYPEGLAPLIAHVRGLGLEFGLWIEPEMVNPDSELYRAHPDWVLATPPAPQLGFRHQLVLDFGRAEVREHLYAAIDTLLQAHPIAYLKWDMNRDLSHPGGADGRAGARAHVLGVYEVLDRLRAAHPEVEIESCASGGGRADYGILARTDRIWTSDSNDALDRVAIQRGFSHFFPPELMGAHVGPETCHITGRRLSMGLRVATALFGHMGVECDLRALTSAEAGDLAAGIALYKAERALLHHADLVRLDSPASSSGVMITDPARQTALLSWTALAGSRDSEGARLRPSGLVPEAVYEATLLWPPRLRADLPAATGEALGLVGLDLPRLRPGTGVVIRLSRR